MGLTVLRVTVANPSDPARAEELEFLVDSGAVYSVAPADVLDRLGIKPRTEEEFRLADGESIRRRKGIAEFRYGGKIGGYSRFSSARIRARTAEASAQPAGAVRSASR